MPVPEAIIADAANNLAWFNRELAIKDMERMARHINKFLAGDKKRVFIILTGLDTLMLVERILKHISQELLSQVITATYSGTEICKWGGTSQCILVRRAEAANLVVGLVYVMVPSVTVSLNRKHGFLQHNFSRLDQRFAGLPAKTPCLSGGASINSRHATSRL